MAVAKSFERMEIISEPFVGSSGRLYVRLRDKCSRCGGTGIWHWGPYGGTCFKCNGSGKEYAEARWYTDEERQKMDARNEAHAEQVRQKCEAEALRKLGAEYNGFQNGYVIVIYGETYSVKEELKFAGARFNYGLGWYFSDESAVPSKFLEQSIRITWEMVSREDKIMSDIDIKEVVQNAIPKPISASMFRGEVGERLRGLELEVVKFWEGPGYYIHTMEDTLGNVYVWMTSARAFEKGTIVRMDATVKKHEKYQGIQQTHLTRPTIKEVVSV